MNWEIFGFVASACFILCGVPQVIECIVRGNGKGISALFIWIWLLGELSLSVYASFGLAFNIPLLLNAIFCTIVCFVIIIYIYFPRRRHEKHVTKKSERKNRSRKV